MAPTDRLDVNTIRSAMVGRAPFGDLCKKYESQFEVHVLNLEMAQPADVSPTQDNRPVSASSPYKARGLSMVVNPLFCIQLSAEDYFFYDQIRLYTTELSSIDEFKPASIDKASTLQDQLNLILADFYTHSPCTPCSANAVNSKEHQLGLCSIQKIDPQRHPTREETVPSDIDSIQESVATVTIPADIAALQIPVTIDDGHRSASGTKLMIRIPRVDKDAGANTSNANATDTAYLCAKDVITELGDNTCVPGINDDPTRCTASDNANNICGCSMPVPPNTRTTTPSKRMITKKTPPEQIISPVNRHGYVITGIPSGVTTDLA
ncbi:hypothetical protein Tco_0637441 [Tanacetum coccineum]